ncbi:MAG: tRNA epoxyqueuosine(34) reductase QueG [Maricaulaceae bacterium]
MRLPKRVLTRISKLGFTPPFIVDLSQFDALAGKRLKSFVDQDYHGDMAWMKETLERRQHPRSLWPDAKSALVLGFNYGPDHDPMDNLSRSEIGNISVYARGRDYHDIMKGRLKEVAGLLARDTEQDVKIFVDTAPLMEKPLAMLAGLGWQGKHTNLVSRDFGSWLFIGTILSAAPLTPTPVEVDHCGSCTACLDICPTDAFPAPYKLDARKCISYLTIEFKGVVPIPLREKMGNRIYGCDDCLAVCPWNKYAKAAQDIKIQAREALNAPDLRDLAALDDKAFRALFSGSPIKRIGRDQFIRNVLYAIGNSGRGELKNTAQDHLRAQSPIIRNAAKWAVQKLS